MSIYQCYVAFMNAMFNISTSKHIRYKLKVSDKTKRRRSGNDFAKQEVMLLPTQAPCKSKGFPWIQNGVCWSCNLAPRYRTVFHGIKYNDYQSTATTKCPGTQLDSSEFFARRMEEYKRTLSVPTTRIEESDAQEICLISNFHHLPFILNELRGHFEGIAEEPERDIDSF